MKLNLALTVRRSLPHLAALLVLFGCVRLALWQIERADEKQRMLDQWDTAAAAELIDPDELDLFAPVTGRGRFDPERHVLLDNQIRNNHPGVHVFTPFQPEGSRQLIMVNRGWHPWDRRSTDRLQIDTPSKTVTIDGRISDPPRVGLQLGEAGPLDSSQWPNLTTYYDTDRIREALGSQTADRVVLLDPDHPAHLTGDDWQMMNMGPERHVGYAFQWASIGLAVFLIWIILTFRSLRRR
ncbi:MAG: SURF1 family protein [Wenzhouxiangella sp.]|nr:MAG: SURF1 family protein [Wenzhouxiangella sp.]